MNLYAIKEKCQHGSIQVPYSYYDCGIPDYFTSVPLHWHSEMELNYIKSGNGFFKYEDQTISAKPGDIFLIQPNVLHAIMSDEHSSFFMIPLFFIRICWWEVTMTVVIQIFCCRSFLPDEEFWSLYLRKPRGIMNSMIRSGLLCSVHTKILQRLICYWKVNCFAYFICWHRHRDSAPNTRFRQNLGWPKHFGLFSLIYRNIILNLSP